MTYYTRCRPQVPSGPRPMFAELLAPPYLTKRSEGGLTIAGSRGQRRPVAARLFPSRTDVRVVPPPAQTFRIPYHHQRRRSFASGGVFATTTISSPTHQHHRWPNSRTPGILEWPRYSTTTTTPEPSTTAVRRPRRYKRRYHHH